MKSKIFSFVLMIVFIISAIHCSVDATDQNHFPIPLVRPDSPPLIPPEVPPFFHIYTIAEMQQIRQNLIGRYQAVFNNQVITVSISTDVFRMTTVLETVAQSGYIIRFPPNSEPIVSFEIVGEDFPMGFYIQFSPHSYTEVIGLHSARTNDWVLEFQRIENQEIHHNEL